MQIVVKKLYLIFAWRPLLFLTIATLGIIIITIILVHDELKNSAVKKC